MKGSRGASRSLKRRKNYEYYRMMHKDMYHKDPRRKKCSCEACRSYPKDSYWRHDYRPQRRQCDHRHSTRSRRHRYPYDDYISPRELISSHLRDIENRHYRKGFRRNDWSTLSLLNARNPRYPNYSHYSQFRPVHPQPSHPLPRFPYMPQTSRSHDIKDEYEPEYSDEFTGRIFEHFLNQRPRGYELPSYPEQEGYMTGWESDAMPSKQDYDWSCYGNSWSEGSGNLPTSMDKMAEEKMKEMPSAYGWSGNPYL